MLVREPRVQPPSLDNYSDMPLFNTKAVVRKTGVPAPTLRAWERRYGILAPHRGDNDYRLYSDRDIAVVSWLRERVTDGMTISQAIVLLRTIEPANPRSRGKKRSVETLSPRQTDNVSLTSAEIEPSRFDTSELRSSLLRHFVEFDEYAANRTIGYALAVHRVEDVCLSLLTPTLYTIGDMWANGELSTVVEHFASSIIRAQLESLFRSSASDDSGPLILVGSAPEELHELGALMLALFLRRTGLHVAYLGQNLEPDGLLRTVEATKPAAILLSATLPTHLGGLREVGVTIHERATTHPLLIFGGQIFSQRQDLAKEVPGEVLNMDAVEAAREMRRRLSA